MKTFYLGLELSSPVIVASSPWTAHADTIEHCAAEGAGAVVLKSIFEEQMLHQARSMTDPAVPTTDAGEYLERYTEEGYRAEYVRLVEQVRRRTEIPVIASLNCMSGSAAWAGYAAELERAGADALELNIFLQPSDRGISAADVERSYAETVKRVTDAVALPVSVKLPMRLTNFLHLSDALLARGARGVVLFNRFFEPDIDVERMRFVQGDPYSRPTELRNVLRSAALAARSLPQLDIAVSTGVHDGEAVVKSILAGACAVQICTAIHRFGCEAIGRMNRYVEGWAERHGFGRIEEFRASMDYGDPADPLAQRAQYMRFFPGS